MPQMSNSQARVIDPILSTHAQGYRHNEHVGMNLFPRVPVATLGGQIIEFGKESFRKLQARRTPGSGTKRVQYGYAGKPFALVNDSLEGMVPREHLSEAAVPGINLGRGAVMRTMDTLSMLLEIEQAELALNASNYDSDHKIDLSAAKWTVDANNPAADIRTGCEAIADTVGIEANTLLLSSADYKAIRENAKIVERFKYVSKDSINAEMIAKLLDLDKVIVGKGSYLDASDDFVKIWGGSVLAYVAPDGGDMDAGRPSYGYTYTLDNSPLVEEAYYEKNAKSWIYPVDYHRAAVLSGMTAGYLFQGAG